MNTDDVRKSDLATPICRPCAGVVCSVQFSSVLMSCSKLLLLMLISSLSHEQVEADLERINRTGIHTYIHKSFIKMMT